MTTTLDKASVLVDHRRFSQAIPLLKEAAQEEPDNEWPLVLLSHSLLELNQPAQALLAGREALNLAPESGNAHLCLARALMATGQSEPAMSHAEEAQRLLPGDSNASLVRAQFLLQKGRPADALSVIDEGLSVEPGDAQILALRVHALLALGRVGEAQADANAAVSADPESSLALHSRAEACVQRGDFEQAESLMQAAMFLDPAAVAHREGLGWIRLRRTGFFGALLGASTWLHRRLTKPLLIGTACVLIATLGMELAEAAASTQRLLRYSVLAWAGLSFFVLVLRPALVAVGQAFLKPRLLSSNELFQAGLGGFFWASWTATLLLYGLGWNTRIFWALPLCFAGQIRYVGPRSDEEVESSPRLKLAIRAAFALSVVAFLAHLASGFPGAWMTGVAALALFFKQT